MKLSTILLTERYINAIKSAEKEKYAQEVWDILQRSYKPVGGIHGSGFNSLEDMIAKIPLWKMVIRDGKVKCVKMYKDNGGRKSVAMGTDGSREGKLELAKVIKDDMHRSYAEVSDAAEKFIMKILGDQFDQFRIPAEQAGKLIRKEVIPSEDGFHYTRKIGGVDHEKIMIGTPGKHLVFYEF